jgi:hypothetical protein
MFVDAEGVLESCNLKFKYVLHAFELPRRPGTTSNRLKRFLGSLALSVILVSFLCCANNTQNSILGDWLWAAT